MVVVIACLTQVGCRSGKRSIIAARSAYALGDLESAETALRELADGPRQTRRESQLDLAMVELATGNTSAAEARFRELRNHFDRLPDHDVAHDVASMAVDDNARQFQIADYEHVLLRSMLAICSLSRDGTDAEAYLLQAQEKQFELKPTDESSEITPSHQRPIALAPYLHGTLREATLQNYDDAERAFRLVSAIKPEFAPASEDIQRVSSGTHSRPGHGVVYIIAFVGQGPRLVETVAPTTTASLQIASTLLRTVEKQEDGKKDEVVLPNIASVKVPVVEIPPSQLAAIGVTANGQLFGATQTLTDIGQLALDKTEAEMPWTIARAVARRVVKETSVAATSKQLGLSGDAATAFEFAAASAWSGVENADTRHWGLLPREIQVMRAELPAGEQVIELAPLGMSGQVFAPVEHYQLAVEDGRNHYCVVLAPEQIVSVVPR